MAKDDLFLSEKDRQKLDGIVSKMIQNGESDDDIKFVVGDFKNKYGLKKKEPTQSDLAAGESLSPSTEVKPPKVEAADETPVKPVSILDRYKVGEGLDRDRKFAEQDVLSRKPIPPKIEKTITVSKDPIFGLPVYKEEKKVIKEERPKLSPIIEKYAGTGPKDPEAKWSELLPLALQTAGETMVSPVFKTIGILQNDFNNRMAYSIPGMMLGIEPSKVKDYSAYKLGEHIDLWSEILLPVSDETKESLAGQLTAGGTSLAGFATLAALGAATGAGPIVLPAIAGAMQNGTSEYDRAYKTVTDAKDLDDNQYLLKYGAGKDYGVVLAEKQKLATLSPDQVAFDTWLGASAIGTLEALPVANWAKRFNVATGGTFSKVMGKGVKEITQSGSEKVLMGAFEEGIEESLTQYLSNANAISVYDKTRDIWEGVAEGGTVGFLLGGTLSGLTHVVQSKLENPNLSKSDKAILDKTLDYLKEQEPLVANIKNDELVKAKDDLPEVKKLKEQKMALEMDYADTKVDPSIKPDIKAKIDEIDNKISDIKIKDQETAVEDMAKYGAAEELKSNIQDLEAQKENLTPESAAIVDKQIADAVSILESLKDTESVAPKAKEEKVKPTVYEEFINTGNVPDATLKDIAAKVKTRETLTEEEKAIFAGKTSEINDIISEDFSKTKNIVDEIKAESLADKLSRLPNVEVSEAGTGTLYITNKKTKERVRVSDHEPNFGAPRSTDYKEIYTKDVSGKEIAKPHEVIEQVSEALNIPFSSDLKTYVDESNKQQLELNKEYAKTKSEQEAKEKDLAKQKEAQIPFIEKNISELSKIQDEAEAYGDQGASGEKRRKRRRNYFENAVKEKFNIDLEYSVFTELKDKITTAAKPTVAETTTTKIVEPKTLTNGTQVQMEPQIKGGMPRIMEFKDGTWFQKVGNELANVSQGVQQEAQDLYDSQNKTRVSGEVGVGQEPIQTKPIERAGKETPSTSRNVQASEKVKESGEFVVQGTFNGHQVIAGNKNYEVSDYRQIGQKGNTELVENTKGDKKIYTLVTPNTDAFNRRGYMGVSLVLPNTTTKTKAEIQSILEAKTAEVKANLNKERPGSFNKAVDMKYEGVTEVPVTQKAEVKPPSIPTTPKVEVKPPSIPVTQKEETTTQAPQKVDETKAGAIELKTMEMANQNVTKFLEDSGIEVNIMNTQEEFDAAQKDEGLAAERGTEGMFISKSGKIYINKSNLGKGWAKTILYHEATHPVINIIRNTNPEKYKALVSGVKELAKTNKDVNDALEWAKKQYAGKPEGTIEDEFVVEVIARIASGRIKFGQIEPTLREKIVEFINQIAKAIGLPPITPKTDTETFKKTARQVADAMRRGKSISKVVGKENVKEFSFAESTSQQRKDSESIAKDTEDKVIEGKIQPSMILNGAKGGQPINLYTGEASIDAIREFKPKMYISRALELSKTHLAKGTTRKYRVDSSLESQLQWADEVYKKAKDTVVSNLLFIYDNTPSHIRDISKLWYDGANIIAQELSSKYGITLEQASAVIATQSPQKPWYDNVHLAHFIIDFNSKNQKTPMSQEDFDYYKLKSSDPKTGKSYTKQVEYLPVLEKSIGTKLEDLSLYDRAVMARTAFDLKYDRKAPLRLPNGVIIGTVKNLSSHSGYDTIAKGLSILQDGSKQNISANLGDAYKVRNFNNNIVNPKASNEVTIDTHAIAASYLLPLGSSSEEVKFDEATYGFFADAYREAAKQRGVLAREMQSITWEGARAIFPSNEKSQAKKDVAKNEWAKYKNGEESLEDVQKTIKQNGNDLSKTDWAAFINRMLEKNESTDYVAELPINSGYKPAVGSGASKRAASGLSSVVKGDRGISKSQKSVGQREDLQKSEKQITFAQDETRRTKEATPSEVSFAERIGRPVGYDALRVGQPGVEERGFTKTDLNKSFKIGGRDVKVKSEFVVQPSVKEGIKANIPNAYIDKALLEITGDPDSYHKFISTVKANHPQGAAVYVYPKQDYANMRLFITPDGEAGVAIKSNGDFVSAFNRHIDGEGRKPNRLAQLMILGIKAGAKKADAFDTVLPNYYSKFGFRVVAKVPFSWDAAPEAFEDEYGNTHKGWEKEDFIDFNKGEPDVTFLVYDGGDRATIQDRVGDFDKYSLYKDELPESTYDEAVEIQNKALKGEAQKSVGGRNLAPNGEPSNLNEVQYKQVRTPEFKKWFGDWENDPENASKIVDENGEPLVVYHGTSSEKDFDKFELNDLSRNYMFFSVDPKFASTYANAKNGRLMPVFINARKVFNPTKLNEKEEQKIFDLIESRSLESYKKQYGGTSYKVEDMAYDSAWNFMKSLTNEVDDNWYFVESQNIKDYIKDNGYDAIYVRETQASNVGVMNANQIKSAIGNSGKFSPIDNRIQMSTGGREVKSTFEEATDLFYKIKNTEGAAKKRALADERKALMDQNPSVKYIDDNIKTILDQLEKKEMATRKGNCP